ncbi:MAG: peptidylprolyl isomerase [Planctomycetota bacterium]
MQLSLRTRGLALSLSLTLLAACGSDPKTGESGPGQEAAGASQATADEPDAGTKEAVELTDVTNGEETETPDAGVPAPTPDAAPDPTADAAPDAAADAGPGAAGDANRFAPGGPISDADLANYHVSMSCTVDGNDVGTMTFDLWTEGAPITTRNFLRLVDEGFYDGIIFHRILRDFMVQGGDPTGTGAGNSPYGTIKAEFSNEEDRKHGYGVLSMARLGGNPDSASCQFFLCCAETQSVWGLDNNYTSFGRMTSGVATLEALANVPVKRKGREVSDPTQKVVIAKARVHEGAAPTGETIERPREAIDLGGEPERIVVQHCLISFQGRNIPGVTRTKEEAEALANQILEQARGGADMDALVRENSDDQVDEGDDTPGHYGILNNGIRDIAHERKMHDLNMTARNLQMDERSGKLSQEDYQARMTELQAEFTELVSAGYYARTGMVPAFGDVGFSLKVGEVGFAVYDPQTSKYGYHIIKRVE